MSTHNVYADLESIIRFSDEPTIETARSHYWRKVEQSIPQGLDFEALKTYIRLLPSYDSSASVSVTMSVDV